ncbi:MAG: hypothetical protein DCC67_17870, partial [Planctomycetota bacterium]
MPVDASPRAPRALRGTPATSYTTALPRSLSMDRSMPSAAGSTSRRSSGAPSEISAADSPAGSPSGASRASSAGAMGPPSLCGPLPAGCIGNTGAATPIWSTRAPVVFKPATLTPKTAVMLIELFNEAGLPPGVLNLVLGSGSEAGDEILNHPAVKAVSFTGSTETGLKIYAQVAPRGVKVQAEMGGK